MEERVKAFSDNAEFYQRSSAFTAKFASYALSLIPPLDASSTVHDNASGPGVVSFVIASKFPNVDNMPQIYATDLAPGMVDMLNSQIQAKSLNSRISAQLVDAQDLKPFLNETFTHSVTNFAIMVEDVPAIRIASEIHRSLKPGGVAIVSTWQRAGTDLIEAVCRRIRPGLEPLQVIPSAWKTKEKLQQTLVAGGFEANRIEVHERKEVSDFEDQEKRLAYFCHPFWGMWRRGWTEEENAKWEKVMAEELVKAFGHGSSIFGIAWIAIATK